MLFASPLTWIGQFFVFFGGLFAIVFGASADFRSPFYFSDSDPVTQGTLLEKKSTNASENKRRIYEYHYRYDAAAHAYEGRSFGADSGAHAGEGVEVQYVADHPGRSHLPGQLLAPFSWEVCAATLIFPAVGLGFLYFTIGRYRRQLALVQTGMLTTGRGIRKVVSTTRINKQNVIYLFFEFITPDGRVHTISVAGVDITKFVDEAREPLLYDASNPANAVLLDALAPEIRHLLTATA